MARLLLAFIFALSLVSLTGPLQTIAENRVPALTLEDLQKPTNLEFQLFDLTNADRIQSGLSPLEFDHDLLYAARSRSRAQQAHASLSHYDASGQLAFITLINDLEVGYARAGENLARVPAPQSSAADRAEVALMESPTHRANILQPEFNRVAIGQVVDSSGHIVFAELFRAAR